jgi:competence protein ComEA
MGAALVLFAMLGRSALAGGGAAAPAPADEATALATPLPPAPDPLRWADAQAPEPIANAAPSSEGSPSIGAPSSHATPDDPVILNLATVTDLQRLPGIGAKRAQAILAVRARLGRFRQIEDLLKVKGIGRATLKRLRPLVRVDAGSAPGALDAGAPCR